MWTCWFQLFYYALALESLQCGWVNSHLICCNREEPLLIKGNKKNKCYSLSMHELSYMYIIFHYNGLEIWKKGDNLQASVISGKLVVSSLLCQSVILSCM